MKTDLTYTTNGLFVTLYAETNEAAQNVWNVIAQEFGGVAKFPAHMFPSIKAQIKAAGYTVRKARKPELTIAQIIAESDALLAELTR